MSTLGLKRGTVQLVPHNSQWRNRYLEEIQFLKSILKDDFIASEHIGSTAIPNIVAKPILDMMVTILDLKSIARWQKDLEAAGYHDRGVPFKGAGHVLFAKGPEDCREIYLKLSTPNSWFWQKNILFRDYLMAHADVAKAYNDLKINIAETVDADDRARYTDQKADFINDIISRAAEAQEAQN